MKNTILLLCAVLAFLLASCGKTPKSGETTTTASGKPGEAAAFLLRVVPEDRNQAFLIQSFVETEAGYYYGLGNHDLGGDMIYFCPRGGKAFYPLCSKPNCRHDDQNCNA